MAAMTNQMIIFMERCKLFDEGKIKGTGIFTEMEINGEIKKLELPEEIHTYNKWKELGYQVRRGEKSQIKFSIWKYRGSANTDEESEENVRGGHCFMKLSAFFTMDQVDKIA